MGKQELYREGAEVLHNQYLSPRIGRLLSPGPAGEVLVEYEGSARVARSVSGVSRSELIKAGNRGRDVLLLFEVGDPNRPIIIGLMEEPLEALVSMEVAPKSADQPKEVVVDGKRVTIEAEEEVVLKCGAGSITLRKDGKIIIKGTHLLSRSSGPNRIKGGSVQIN
ncbi:MAG: DUF6484 domain-containing protein [Candidatus Manganitrophus sp. SA1]|nr:DUF6484 domain-containing protein [Candidatus Manganitrophus morganii]